jgi:hypothetical protein
MRDLVAATMGPLVSHIGKRKEGSKLVGTWQFSPIRERTRDPATWFGPGSREANPGRLFSILFFLFSFLLRVSFSKI